MSAFETSMWRSEVDPALCMSAMVGEQLDRAPDWDRLVEAHRWAVRVAPRLRQRVVEPPLGLGAPRWSDDPDFDLRYHLRHQRLPEGGGWAALYEAVAQIGMTPLDRHRPPWEAVLFEGLPEGRAMYLLKLHHAATDGMGAMALLSRLHSRSREHNPHKPAPPLAPPASVTPWDALGAQVRHDLGAIPRMVRGAGTGLASVLADPVSSVREGAAYVGSLARVLGPTEGGPSPLLAARSRQWALAAVDVPFADLRAAGRAAGGSYNDAFLAAVLGGFRRYHERMGAEMVDAVPTTVPISLRSTGDVDTGNNIATVQVAGPVRTVDPAKRIGEVRAVMRAARDEPAANIIGALSPAVARLPAPVIAGLSGSMAKSNDLQASNVPGVAPGSHIAGARIERMYGFGPLPGCAVMAIMVSYEDVGCIGVTVDRASVTDPDLFRQCLVEGCDEVLALRPRAGGAVARL